MPDPHFSKREDNDFFADPDIVITSQTPRKRDIDAAPDDNPFANTSPKNPEPENPERGWEWKPASKKNTADD
jgi:hypothetical protein